MTDTPDERQEQEPRQRRGADPRLTTAVAVLLLIGAVYVLMQSKEKPVTPFNGPALKPAAEVRFDPLPNGEKAPDFTLKTLDGDDLTFSEFKKGKYAVVVFYTPCGTG